MTIRSLILLACSRPSLSLALDVGIWEYADCLCGNPNGFATASASGGTPPNSYLWSNGASTATAQGLAPGTYIVTVTDAALEQATAEIIIGEVPSILYVSFSGAGPHGCNGLCNGDRNITVYPLPANLAQPVTFAPWAQLPQSFPQTMKTWNGSLLPPCSPCSSYPFKRSRSVSR